jgi:hypothetical protein
MRKLTSLFLTLALVAAATAARARDFAAPVAISFSATVASGKQNIVQLQGSDADGTPLTFETLSAPTHGALSGLHAATGEVTYTPAAGYVGSDSFTYKVASGGDDSTTAKVMLTVSSASEINDALGYVSRVAANDVAPLDSSSNLRVANLPATINAAPTQGIAVSTTPHADGDSRIHAAPANLYKYDASANLYKPIPVLSDKFNSLAAGISNYWKLEEGGSNLRTDSAGTTPLTPTTSLAAVGWALGKIGSSQPLYSPENRYLYAPDSVETSVGDNSFTISTWVYLDPAGQSVANPGIVTKWGAVDADREYYLLYDNTGALGGTANRFVFGVMSGSTKTQVMADFVPTTNTFYHVVAIRSKEAHTISLRINNGTVYSVAQTGAVNDGAAQLQLGAVNGGDALTGMIDETAIWKRALTLPEQDQLDNSGKGLQYDFVDTSKNVSRNYSYSIKDDFHASGSDRTTTGTINSGTATLTVTDASDFVAGQGVLVPNAGVGGGDLVTTIVGIVGNVFALADSAAATATGVTVIHDDTKATQDSLDRCAGELGCSVDWPDGTYNWNRPLNPNCHAIVCLPFHNTRDAAYTIQWNGRFVSRTSPKALPTKGVIVKSQRVVGTGTYPSILAAAAYSDTAVGYPAAFNYTFFEIHNFAFITATDPSLTVLNLHNAIGTNISKVQFFPGADPTAVATGSAPTHSQTHAILMPGENNHTQSRVTDVSGYGFYNGISMGEHTIVDHAVFSLCKNGIAREGGGHPAMIYSAQVEACTHAYVANGSGPTVAFEFGLEIDMSGAWYSTTANQWIYDPSNIARGDFLFNYTTAGGGVGNGLPQRTGFQFTRLRDLYSGTEKPVGTP